MASSVEVPRFHHDHPTAAAPSSVGVPVTAAAPGQPVVAAAVVPPAGVSIDVGPVPAGVGVAGDAYGQGYTEDDLWDGSIVNYMPDEDYYRLMRTRRARTFGEKWIGYPEFRRPHLWRATLAELVGTMLWVVFLCGAAVGFNTFPLLFTTVPPVFVFGMLNILILPFLIYATAPHSGGHLNPIITLATFCAGFTSLARTFLYIIAQFVGGIMGAAIIWGWSNGSQRNAHEAGVCSLGPNLTNGMGVLIESTSMFFFLFIVFGVAFDRTQRRIYGGVLSPIFLSIALGIIFVVSGMVGRYGGAWINPTRCFGAALISGVWTDEVWISIVSWLIASVGMGVYYWLVPFVHHHRYAAVPAREVRVKY